MDDSTRAMPGHDPADELATAPGLHLRGLRAEPLGAIDLDVSPGECIGLAGPSGSGKSRLLRAIADLDPTPGRVWLDGVERDRMTAPQWRGRVVMVPAESHWWGDRLADHFHDCPDAGELSALGLEGISMQSDPADLSSGERQRLALLRALSAGPKCLLLDEPTANLDEDSAQRVEAWLAERRRHGLAVIWVSHDPAQIARVAQQIYRIRGGRLEGPR